MRNKYRICTDSYNGYEAQVKRWWWPFWINFNANTKRTIAECEELCISHSKNGSAVKYIGKLP